MASCARRMTRPAATRWPPRTGRPPRRPGPRRWRSSGQHPGRWSVRPDRGDPPPHPAVMQFFFAFAFLGGLLLGVQAMLHGVERPPRVGPEVDAFGRALQAARTSLKAPTAAAFLT